jgi:hypothetical protein
MAGVLTFKLHQEALECCKYATGYYLLLLAVCAGQVTTCHPLHSCCCCCRVYCCCCLLQIGVWAQEVAAPGLPQEQHTFLLLTAAAAVGRVCHSIHHSSPSPQLLLLPLLLLLLLLPLLLLLLLLLPAADRGWGTRGSSSRAASSLNTF